MIEPLARPRVLQRLRHAARRRIVIIHGIAGCGKSVAIRAYLASQSRQFVHFAVRYEHRDVTAFVRALSEALAPLYPRLPELFSAAVTSARRQEDPWNAVASWFAQLLDGPITIAIDELHRLDDERSFRFLTQLVDGTDANVHWILAARSTASLPLPRWLASGAADASIDETYLAVQADDVHALSGALDVRTSDIEALSNRRDGSIGAIVSLLPRMKHLFGLIDEHLDAVVTLAVLPALEAEVALNLPSHFKELVREFRESGLFQTTQGDVAMDEWARTRSYEIAARESGTILRRSRTVAARALELSGRISEALQLYINAESIADVARILTTHGFQLQDGGRADLVSSAINVLPFAERRNVAVALMLEATDEASRGRYDVSEAWFEQALERARNPVERMRIDVAYSSELLRRGRNDGFDRLELLAEQCDQGPTGVSFRAALAVGHAQAGRLPEARDSMNIALRALASIEDVAVRAAVHQRAAFVTLMLGDAPCAQEHADIAAALGQEYGNEELVAVAKSVAYSVASSHTDDPSGALAALRRMQTAGERCGNAFFRRFALIGSYEIAAQQNDVSTLITLGKQLEREELEASILHVEDGLLPARAMQAGWNGDFESAHRMLMSTAGRQPSSDTQALRWAEIALYSVLSGGDDQANDDVDRAVAELAGIEYETAQVQALTAGLLATLTLQLLDRGGEARQCLGQIAPMLERWPRWNTFYEILSMTLSASQDQFAAELLLDKLDRMSDEGLGGYARLLASIPTQRIPSVAN